MNRTRRNGLAALVLSAGIVSSARAGTVNYDLFDEGQPLNTSRWTESPAPGLGSLLTNHLVNIAGEYYQAGQDPGNDGGLRFTANRLFNPGEILRFTTTRAFANEDNSLSLFINGSAPTYINSNGNEFIGTVNGTEGLWGDINGQYNFEIEFKNNGKIIVGVLSPEASQPIYSTIITGSSGPFEFSSVISGSDFEHRLDNYTIERVVPLPSAVGMGALGLAGIAASRKKRDGYY